MSAPPTDLGPHGVQLNDLANVVEPAVATVDDPSTSHAHGPREDSDLNFVIPDNVMRFNIEEINRGEWPNRKIGEGATANVFAGIVNGKTVAIKHLKCDPNSKHTFENELKILRNLKHPSIVKLLGVSLRVGSQYYILSEYMKNGSLDNLLFSYGEDEEDGEEVHPLTWKCRLQIALDVINGLNYLHDGPVLEKIIIHCDLKPANILLDESLNAHITDFGFTVEMKKGETDILRTNQDGGTFGYMDPCLLTTGTVAPSSDIYAFGAILLDLVKGKDILPKMVDGEVTTDYINGIKDRKLGSVPLEDLREFIMLAKNCLKYERSERPSIEEIVEVLENIMGRS